MNRMLLAVGFAVVASFARDAHASVSLAVDTDRLLARAEVVMRATSTDTYSAWEGTRIVTYTKLHVDEVVAGNVKDSDVWVRTLGGQVEHLGQWVDGEPVFGVGQSSLVFLSKDEGGAYVSVARAQGQIPLEFEAKRKSWLTRANPHVGLLLPRPELVSPAAPPAAQLRAQATGGSVTALPTQKVSASSLRAAGDELAGKTMDELRRDLSLRWSKAHRP